MQLSKINGYRVSTKHFDTDLANVRVVVHAGSIHEEKNGDNGIAHFLEHMFFKGTQKRDCTEIKKITSRLGGINAFTSNSKTVYHLTCLNHKIQESIETLLEMVFLPAFPEDEFNKEKGVILTELQTGLDNPQSYFFGKLRHHIYGDNWEKVIGTKESITNMTIDHLNNYHKKYYNPNNMLISIGSNIDSDIIHGYVKNSIPEIETSEHTTENIEAGLHNENLYVNHPTEQSMLCYIFKGIGSLEKKKSGPLKLLTSIVGGGMHSMLFSKLREELALCYGVGMANDSVSYKTGSAFIYTSLDEKNIDLAKENIELIIKDVITNGVSEELFDISKENILFKLANGFSDPMDHHAILADSYFDKDKNFISYQEKKSQVENTTIQNVNDLANELFNDQVLIGQMTQSK